MWISPQLLILIIYLLENEEVKTLQRLSIDINLLRTRLKCVNIKRIYTLVGHPESI